MQLKPKQVILASIPVIVIPEYGQSNHTYRASVSNQRLHSPEQYHCRVSRERLATNKRHTQKTLDDNTQLEAHRFF